MPSARMLVWHEGEEARGLHFVQIWRGYQQPGRKIAPCERELMGSDKLEEVLETANVLELQTAVTGHSAKIHENIMALENVQQDISRLKSVMEKGFNDASSCARIDNLHTEIDRHILAAVLRVAE